MKSFNHFLREKGVSNNLRSLLYHIARSVKYINFSIRAGNTGKSGGENCFGEKQMRMDMLSDQIITDELRFSELAGRIASEEQESCQDFSASRGSYFVAYDPLDGSSLVDANLAIGSIFGIWDRTELIGTAAGENLVASCYAVYGPRITLVISVRGLGVHEFELNDVGEFILTRESITIEDQARYFAPGNLRVCPQNPEYKKWIDDCIQTGKTLRYSGGMVPDLHHIFSKGNGVFCYPRDEKNPNGKLRLLFECAPFALAFSEAGGSAKNQEGQNILQTRVEEYHQNSPIFIGSKKAVDQVLDFIK
jgi:fructose-1,6-bisphosphatase I